jgi:hypothetical protein
MSTGEVRTDVKQRARAAVPAPVAPVVDQVVEQKRAQELASRMLVAYMDNVPSEDRAATPWQVSWMRAIMHFPKLRTAFRPFVQAVRTLPPVCTVLCSPTAQQRPKRSR